MCDFVHGGGGGGVCVCVCVCVYEAHKYVLGAAVT